MAFSEAQYKNFIKVIAVSAVAKEFRKSAIMKKIEANIRRDNLIATSRLVRFKSSKSIIPTSDDRWLVDEGNIKIKTVELGPKLRPVLVSLDIKIRYGLTEEKYFYLTSGSPNRKWFPNVDRIADWIKIKQAKGKSFTITKRGVTREARKDWEIKSVAYVIARGISQNGIKKRDFLEPFKNKRFGVEASLSRANEKIVERLSELYGTTFVDIQNDIISNVL